MKEAEKTVNEAGNEGRICAETVPLVERLRAYYCPKLSSCWFEKPTICSEAAAEIECLRRDNAHLRAQLEAWNAELRERGAHWSPDIVEELRADADAGIGWAASNLRRAAAEIERLTNALGLQGNELDAHIEDNKRLRAALQDLTDRWPTGQGYGGAIKRARRALEGRI